VRVVLGFLGLVITGLGLVGSVFGYYLGGLSDDPQAQLVLGVAGAIFVLVGLYMLFQSLRDRP
jgi:uncharacterized membrane protein YfcA